MCCNNLKNPVEPCYAMYSSISNNKFCQMLHQNEHCIATYCHTVLFFLRISRGMRTPKHFVNLTGESSNF
jgi:hypothetical protein